MAANIIWRFFIDTAGSWRWQQLGTDHSVIADSSHGYSTYDDCVLAATACGYRNAPSQAGLGLARKHYYERWS